MTEVFSARFPHSDICGSLDICSSPQLFAAYHVILRLLVPRHPPCALISLTIVSVSSDSHILCIALHRIWCLLVFSAFVNSRINRYLSITFAWMSDIYRITFVMLYIFSQYTVFNVPISQNQEVVTVETERFELLTPCLQGRCSPN